MSVAVKKVTVGIDLADPHVRADFERLLKAEELTIECPEKSDVVIVDNPEKRDLHARRLPAPAIVDIIMVQQTGGSVRHVAARVLANGAWTGTDSLPAAKFANMVRRIARRQ